MAAPQSALTRPASLLLSNLCVPQGLGTGFCSPGMLCPWSNPWLPLLLEVPMLSIPPSPSLFFLILTMCSQSTVCLHIASLPNGTQAPSCPGCICLLLYPQAWHLVGACNILMN